MNANTSLTCQAEAAKDLGNEAIKNRKFDEAVAAYSQAIQLDSKNATYYSNRSAAYVGLRKWTEALADAEQSISLDPKFVRVRAKQGTELVARC